MRVELELVDIYSYEGLPGKRYRFRLKGTNVYINVAADNVEDAVKKVEEMIRNLGLDGVQLKVAKQEVK